MGEKATPTTTTQNTSSYIPDWLSSASQGVVGNATNGGIPGYTAYGGPNTQAGLTPQQLQALGIASGTAGTTQGTAAAGLPGYTNALNFAAPTINANSLNSEVSGLLGSSSPFTQNLVNAANAQMDTNTQQSVDNANVNLAANHAFGGSAPGVADANIYNQANINKNAVDANLYQGGYNNALSTALTGQTTNAGNAVASEGINLSGAAGLGNLSQLLSGLNTSDISNLMSTGGQAQSTQSGQNAFDWQKYLESYQIPDTQMSTIASILGSVPHNTTGTSTTQSQMFTNPLMSAMGLGLGAFALSDRRVKTGVRRVGSLDDGTPVYLFRYRGTKTWQIGLMAQDVERFAPEAVIEIDGIKLVNYEKATERARHAGELLASRGDA